MARRRASSIILALIGSCLIQLTPHTAQAFTLSEYWPLSSPAAWIMDHDVLLATGTTQSLGSKTSYEFFLASAFCPGPCGQYVYVSWNSSGLQLLGIFDDGALHDISATPLTLAAPTMEIGDSTSSTVPAGVLDDAPVTLTVTLTAQENVTVPAGSFTGALVLQFQINDSPTTHYLEKIWLAKGVGPVKIVRISETPTNYDGCFFTCGSFDQEEFTIVDRTIQLNSTVGLSPLDVDDDGHLGLAEAISILKTLTGN